MTNEQKQFRIAELETIISTAKLEIKEIRRTMPRRKCLTRCSSCALLSRTKQGGLTWCDAGHSSVMVDSRDTFFEALSMKNAVRRVEMFKAGHIKDLCNLTVRTGSISIF